MEEIQYVAIGAGVGCEADVGQSSEPGDRFGESSSCESGFVTVISD